MAHKTFGGMVKAIERTILELDACPLADDREYRAASKKVDGLLGELNALWSNPADVAEAKKLKVRLLDAWNGAVA